MGTSLRRDAVLKAAFPLVVCGLLNVAAYLQAKGLDALVSATLMRDTPVSAPASQPNTSRPTSRSGHATSADPVLDRNPFDSITGPLVGPRTSRHESRASEGSCAGVMASLVAVGDDPSWSFASLAAPGAPPLLRRIGDEVAGRTVMAIRRDRVVLSTGELTCEVKLGARASVAPAPSAATNRAETADAVAGAVTRIDDDTLLVRRSALGSLLERPTALLGRVRVRPAEGGMRVSGVRPGSPLAALGLHDGDVLKSVGGAPLDDPASSVGALMRLVQADHVEVVIARDGVDKKIHVDIRD